MKRQILLACFALAAAAQTTKQVEWPYYGNDLGNSGYSRLTVITAKNIKSLQIAWQWKHFDTPMEEWGTAPGFFEATPLMIDGVLYVTTPYNNVAALDATTGKELWRFDGEGYKLGQVLSGSGWKLRGTPVVRDGANLRILLNSRNRLFELNAKTGKPVPSFGKEGVVSLTDGL